MKRILIASLLAAFATGALARELEIRHAAEVEFETEHGRYYQIQRSTNLVDWQNLDDRIYGHGRRERHLYSGQGGGSASREFFRVVMTDAPTNGLAPVTFAGLTLNLDDQPGGDLMQFTTETNGVDLGVNPDPFSYVLTSLSANSVQVNLTGGGYYEGIKRDIYVFTFTAPGIGTWARDEYRKGVLKDRDTGVFTVVSGSTPGNPGGTNQPPAGTNSVPTVPPAALAGLVYLFQSGATPDRLEFLTATTGIEIEDNERPGDDNPNKLFTYTYVLSNTNTASLIVNLPNDRRDEYDLTFTVGAQGSFVRREFRNGALDDTDNGSFSPSAQPPTVPPGGTNQPPLNTNAPPANPQGFTYTMLSGAIPERLSFLSATAGLQLDDSAPTDFTYTYQSTGANTFSLVVQFKADKWDEYDLTFTDGGHGSFVRREFDDNELKDTDTAQFTVGPTVN